MIICTHAHCFLPVLLAFGIVQYSCSDLHKDFLLKRGGVLIFVNISARQQQYNSFSLFSLNLHVRPGQLVAVVGHVGAGKSSLVQALLGEMDKLAGSITLRVSTAAGEWVW